MSGKWKKIIWLICMIELCMIHGAYLANLLIYHHMKRIAVFVCGTLVMSVIQYLSYRRFMKDCVQDLTMLEDEKIREIFCKANEQAGNAKSTQSRIYANPQIRIPFVMGFFTQSVIIPATYVKDSNLFFTFLHECYHIKRHDTLYKYVMLACNCFLWFHPLAYFFRYISYRDIEVSCDEAVVKGRSKEERYQYGKLLLESAGKEREKGKAYSAYWNDSKSILKCRIQAVMEEKRTWDRMAGAAVVFLIAEVFGLAAWSVKYLHIEYQEVNKPADELESVVDPPMYTDEALQKMPEEKPVSSDIYSVISQDEKLYLQTDTGDKIEIPVEKECFRDPGDPLTGASNGIRKECYQCDQNKVIFVYGQDGQGVNASIYENGSWNKVAVTNEYPYGLSKIYVDFPEDGEVGYIFGVVERVVFQEGCVLYKTVNGGITWEQVAMSENAAQHSLTMDFDFLTEQNGYLAIHSSYLEPPELLRTEDGGITWEPVTFDEVPEYYCQAYAPEIQDGKLVLFVGMEEYSEMKGEKAYYESADDGRTWNYKKQVIRQ